jgi:hypothetical protein
MKIMKTAWICLALLALAACNRTAQTTAAGEDTTTTVQTVAPPVEPIELTGIDLHFVNLPYAFIFSDSLGGERAYKQAWMVLLHFKKPLPITDMGRNFFIGDYRIPEYGDSRDGIYFRIYEESQLLALDSQEVFMQFDNGKKETLGQKFSTQGYKALVPEEENVLLKRRN